ncbi:hypothetical protein CDAR_420301 [Caerostris darwini]|uniref:Uncharacterized protein n=1 Tax=Caerostris darwini TaxID=1538125 RepID=A0AAV4TUI1_9ARAC|nr:hypothetical protein CDAR_420301 [Caerostris darwini]
MQNTLRTPCKSIFPFADIFCKVFLRSQAQGGSSIFCVLHLLSLSLLAQRIVDDNVTPKELSKVIQVRRPWRQPPLTWGWKEDDSSTLCDSLPATPDRSASKRGVAMMASAAKLRWSSLASVKLRMSP